MPCNLPLVVGIGRRGGVGPELEVVGRARLKCINRVLVRKGFSLGQPVPVRVSLGLTWEA